LIADTTGLISQKIGSVGSGLEEFRYMASFGIDKDTIIFVDGSLDLVKKFTLDGTLIGMHERMLKIICGLALNGCMCLKGIIILEYKKPMFLTRTITGNLR
jgi:hypothetical protein